MSATYQTTQIKKETGSSKTDLIYKLQEMRRDLYSEPHPISDLPTTRFLNKQSRQKHVPRPMHEDALQNQHIRLPNTIALLQNTNPKNLKLEGQSGHGHSHGHH